MKKYINIGTKIDLQDLIQNRLLVQANSGGGKSVIARDIIEESFGQVPFIMMDLEGEYYTLKEKFGDILIIGGQHADIPINLKSAALLPREIIGNRISVIVDLSDLKLQDRILYSKYFLEAMMELPMDFWVNYFIFIEESHKLCGEQDKQASASAVKDLMTRGRKRGYCGVLITQRISKLHKDAAAECNNKFIGRTVLDIDIERASKELGLTSKTERNAMRDLQPGNFFAFGTSIVPNSVHKVKINLPQTKIPKAGMDLQIKPKQPTEKLKAMLLKLNVLPTEVKKEFVKNTAFSVKNYEPEYRTAVKQNAELIKQLEEKDKIITSMKKDANAIIEICSKTVSTINNPEISYSAKAQVVGYHAKTQVVGEKNTSPLQPNTGLNIESTELSKCALSILQFLGTFPDRSFSKAQIGVASGYSANSGGFNNALSELYTKTFIVKDGANRKASENAHKILGPNFQPKEYSIHTYTSKLGKCEREIYEALLSRPNEAFSKVELTELTPSKYSSGSGGFNNALSKLSTLELIERKNGQIQLNPELVELM